MNKISGTSIAQEIIHRLKKLPLPNKKLIAILVGNDSASRSFIAQKKKTAELLGIKFELTTYPKGINQQTLTKEIKKLAQDQSIGGILIQLPLSEGLDTQSILDLIPPEKDIDVLSTEAIREGQVLPPSAGTVQEISSNQKFNLEGKTVTVVGVGRLVGQPIVSYLKHQARDIITINLDDDITKVSQADLVISGVGKPRLLNPNILKKGAAVIDFGYGKINEHTLGDLDTTNQNALEQLSFYTPTPGGTGPILTAKLIENFFLLNQYSQS